MTFLAVQGSSIHDHVSQSVSQSASQLGNMLKMFTQLTLADLRLTLRLTLTYLGMTFADLGIIFLTFDKTCLPLMGLADLTMTLLTFD